MDALLQDIRYAVRKLMRTPSFTAIAVTTLALGIGATTAMWTIVDGVLLRPLPYDHPEQLVQVGSVGREGRLTAMSAPDFIDYRDQSTSFVGMAGMDDGSENLVKEGSEPTRIPVATVGANFFDLLGIAPQRGRYFLKGEDVRGANKVVVLSDALWRSRFAADPSLLGKTISLNGTSYTVVGIAPRKFNYPNRVDAWRPLIFADWMLQPDNRGAHFMSAIGRVKPDVSLEHARQDVSTIAKRLAAKYPDTNEDFGGTVESLQERIIGSIGTALKAMLGAVFFVLLIACANVANLLLVRAAARETEMAVRTALGAGRGRIVRQLITESALLALTGAALGIAVAAWILVGVTHLAGTQVPRLDTVSIDLSTFVFAAAMALITGVIFGLAPALHAARSSIGQMLRASARSGGAAGANRTRSTLVIVELALAMILLVGAGLLGRSFTKLMAVDPGFNPDGVVSFRVSLPESRYKGEPEARAFVSRMLSELQQVPGTRQVAAAFFRPFDAGMMRTSFSVRGEAPRPADQRLLTVVVPASPSYFSTMGIAIKSGRAFDESENGFRGEPVVVVNEALAKKYFPAGDAIGKYLTLGIDHDTASGAKAVTAQGRIIGIAADARQRDLKTDVLPATYLPYNTYAVNEMSFVVKTSAPLGAVSGAIRSRVRQVDGELPIYSLQTMKEALSASAAQPRFFMALLVGFAALALILAAVGIYGVISYTVAQRTREMGIRIALGATEQRVMNLVVGHGAMLAGAGLLLGLVGAASLTRLISNMLFQTPPLDPLTFVGVTGLLGAIAVVAAWLPARRAARVDPVIAMRAE